MRAYNRSSARPRHRGTPGEPEDDPVWMERSENPSKPGHLRPLIDQSPGLFVRDARSARYYRNAVEGHWDPASIDLVTDARALQCADPGVLAGLSVPLANFGTGERSVTTDLAPLSAVLEPVEDPLFLATPLSEEATHTDCFDRYWREVITPAERAHGREPPRRRPSAGSTRSTTTCSRGPTPHCDGC